MVNGAHEVVILVALGFAIFETSGKVSLEKRQLLLDFQLLLAFLAVSSMWAFQANR